MRWRKKNPLTTLMITTDSTNRDETPFQWRRLWLGLAAVLAVMVGSFGLAIWIAGNGTFDNPGEVGDVFGLANALFSGLAFSILIVTLELQREELRLQRRELRETRTVLAAQERELKNQTVAAITQTEEARSFEIINYHTRVLRSLRFDAYSNNEIGLSAFDRWYEDVNRTYAQFVHVGKYSEPQALKIALSKLDEASNADYSRYLASLKATVRLLANCQYADRVAFRNLLWSSMSLNERILLYYSYAHRQQFLESDAVLFVRFGLVQGVEPRHLLQVAHESPEKLSNLQECHLERDH